MLARREPKPRNGGGILVARRDGRERDVGAVDVDDEPIQLVGSVDVIFNEDRRYPRNCGACEGGLSAGTTGYHDPGNGYAKQRARAGNLRSVSHSVLGCVAK